MTLLCLVGLLLSIIDLEIGPSRSLEIELDGQVSRLAVTGDNPHFLTEPLQKRVDLAETPVLVLDVFAEKGVRNLRISVPRPDGHRALLPKRDIPPAEAWQSFRFDLSAHTKFDRLEVGGRLLFQLDRENVPFRLRSIRFDRRNQEESRSASFRKAYQLLKLRNAERYLTSIRKEHTVEFDSAVAGLDNITLFGSCDPDVATGSMQLAMLPLSAASFDCEASQVLRVPISRSGQQIRVQIPRFGPSGLDRATHRFVLLDKETRQSISSVRYVTEWTEASQRPLEKLSPMGKKGLGGVPRGIDRDHEIFELGIHHATINVVVDSLVSDRAGAGFQSAEFEGREVFFNESSLSRLESQLRVLRERNVVASVILLIRNRRDESGRPRHPLVHPMARATALYSMPNLSSEQGAFLYRAVLSHLSERFSKPGPNAARISNWIIHNEVDQSGTWTSMGEQPLESYVEMYLRSTRLTYQIARRYNPHARVFPSLTHHWTKVSQGLDTFCVRDLMDLFAEAARAEGDFEWGLAYHPYPQDLRAPETWLDTQAIDSVDSPYITPKNISVLPRYFDQEHFRYNGAPRAVFLSEQGINARSLSESDQQLQAAGIVYQYRQMRRLPTVEAFHYHAYRDNPGAEGGLRLGLITETGARKAAWRVYEALDSPEEAAVCDFANELFKTQP